MFVSMAATARPQQRYDHRLRNLVQRTRDVAVAADLAVPRSTARGWRGAPPTVVVVCLDVEDLTEPELRQELLKLRRRVLRVSPYKRASAGRTRQDADPARRGSGPRIPTVASGPAVSCTTCAISWGTPTSPRRRATCARPRCDSSARSVCSSTRRAWRRVRHSSCGRGILVPVPHQCHMERLVVRRRRHSRRGNP